MIHRTPLRPVRRLPQVLGVIGLALGALAVAAFTAGLLMGSTASAGVVGYWATTTPTGRTLLLMALLGGIGAVFSRRL